MTPFYAIAGYGETSEDADLVLDFRRDRGNVQFDASAYARDLGASLSPALLDWLEIAAAIYCLDIAARRGVHDEWTRNLALRVAVREPSLWEAIQGDLTQALANLSGDNLTIEFTPLNYRQRQTGEIKPSRDFDGVALLSGGLDSFAGGIDLLDRGKQPLFLSHRTGNSTVALAQHAAHRRLEQYARRGLPWLPVTLRPRSDRPVPFPEDAHREETQRVRSFLFLSLACVAAAAMRVEKVWIHENGILTYPIPLTAARLGSRSTHSTHPRLLRYMERLSQHIADWKLTIANPFHLKTKQDIVRRIARSGCGDALADLVTCWRIGRIAKPCGICLPCLLRQIAVAGCHLTDTEHERVILNEPGEPVDREAAESRRNLGELLRLVRNFLVLPDSVILSRYPEIFVSSRDGARTTQVLQLYRRFAEEAANASKTHYPQAHALLETLELMA